MTAFSKDDLKSFEKWIPALERTTALKRTQYKSSFIYSLNLPAQFEIQPKVLQMIRKEYDPYRERGGILFAQPTNIKSDIRNFKIHDAIFLDNIVPVNEQEYSYMFDRNEFYSSVEDCFAYSKNKPICYPIVFHTHPTFSLEDTDSMLRFFQQSRTSKEDQKLSDFQIVHNGKYLSLPNALIVINPKLAGQYFIGFFGGRIAPDCFEDYMLKLTGKTILEIYLEIKAWAAGNEVRTAFVIAITTFLLGAAMYNIKDVFPFIVLLISLNIIPITRTFVEQTPFYFSQIIDSGSPKSIFFPKT